MDINSLKIPPKLAPLRHSLDCGILFPVDCINPADADKFRAGSSTICLTPTFLCSARQA